MNTCKATLRVLFAHRVYLMIYLVFIGILMMSISWAMLTSASGSMSAVFESTKTRVAIIDRDSDRGDIATSMRAYLRDSSELVDLDDTSETLQQAVARGNKIGSLAIQVQGDSEGLPTRAQLES
mgnify:CR=1 FL=1